MNHYSLASKLLHMMSHSLGQYLYEEVCKQPGYEVVFIWNRSIEKMKDLVSEHLILRDLNDCSSR